MSDVLHLVTAIVKPHRLDEVRDAVKELGMQGMTITEARGFGRQGGHTELYRGAEYQVDFVPKLKVEVLVESHEAEKVAEAIATAAHTGKIGDGKIWVTPVERATRIRTGEVGAEAL